MGKNKTWIHDERVILQLQNRAKTTRYIGYTLNEEISSKRHIPWPKDMHSTQELNATKICIFIRNSEQSIAL